MRQQNSTLQLRVASGPRNGRERLRGHAQLSSVVRPPSRSRSKLTAVDHTGVRKERYEPGAAGEE